MVRHHGLEYPRVIVGRRVTESVKVWKSPKDLPRVIGEVCVTLAQGEYGEDCVFGTMCPQV